MKQTAVEWLCNEWLYIDQEFDMCLIDKNVYWEKLRKIQEQAKAMEKEQIIKAVYYTCSSMSHIDLPCGEQYYKQTFKSE